MSVFIGTVRRRNMHVYIDVLIAANETISHRHFSRLSNVEKESSIFFYIKNSDKRKQM